VRGFIDLHSHWVAGVDDGAKTDRKSLALLQALRQAGFDYVVATPHMRPGMFDNERAGLTRAYEETVRAVGASEATAQGGLPRVGLASEHFFDDVVFERLVAGQGLPYPGGKSALVEFAVGRFPARVEHRLIDLKRKGLIPVIAHPERYEGACCCSTSPRWRASTGARRARPPRRCSIGASTLQPAATRTRPATSRT